ncbi:F-actin-monooxygenase MICAL3-like isoform X5 [Uloborus diversus]|uniref:F-actin-monooxygenase MICAL3-like isoform X5 n=1 Tax=Uloborus diversus TaxID=327109 RepID=UPI0024095827|nr:F-actin-monooxygenase MICAL3-like isoform X5 [Uloborus diversus]
MANPKSLVDINEGTTVSNSSPQSPPGSALLEIPITLDFDPMSFQFKEDSPLTSPDSPDFGEMPSPTQNPDVVDFFDPFCPVKEESPTDYYPNVMLGQVDINEPVLDPLSEQQFSSGFSNYEIQEDILSESCQEVVSEVTTTSVSIAENVDEDNDLPESTFDADESDAISRPELDLLSESENICNQSKPVTDLSDDALSRPDELLLDFGPSSECSAVTSPKSEISADVELLTELEQSEEAVASPDFEQVFDDNQHDLISQHEQYQISEDDVSRKSRTSSSSSSHTSRSERTERRTYKSSESSNIIEDKKLSNSVSIKKENEIQKKEIISKKSPVKTETNGFSSHNGIENSVSLKNSINSEHGKISYEDKSDGLASVTDLKSSFTKSSEDSLQNSFQEEVKPSVDRVKVQRTFSQSAQDDLCLCKICEKHVYQMEKLKAEKSVFHKNCFRCKECNKLLTVDSYSSNEGDIYCKPHFRKLFQPKARFDGEDGAPRKQRRNEMIIRENVPAELPPDVVRADSKPDHGLENIPVNLSSIKSKFETYREEHHLPSTTDVCTLQRSASVMARLAKYQSAVSGGENENGEVSESEDEEECSEDPTVIKHSKHKEKVVFSGMSSLKSQWETGSVAATKEERIEEKKEELNKLRQRMCLGRSESMKAVYEKACQDTSKVTAGRTDPVDLGREVKATRIKEKFEKGELVSEVEEENLEKFRKEKEEDLSVFTEPGIANDAKKLFKQIDATVKTAPVTIRSPNKSPVSERHLSFHSPNKDVDVIKCSEPTEKEEIHVDTTDVTQRFKFFENYSDSPKERKRFQITPPREPVKEDSPERQPPHDPNVVRSVDVVDDIPSTDTARRMLDKFKQLEKEAPSVPSGPKPLKRITPPREYTKVDESHDSSPEPERDPSIIRSSYRVDDDIVVEADKAKSLRAKFENWDTELRENRRNEEEEEEDFLPQVDTTKTLRAKFEAIKEDTLKPIEKPKPKVNRFI